MNNNKSTCRQIFYSVCLMLAFPHAAHAEEIHIGKNAYVGFKADNLVHFGYEKHPEKKIFLVSRLSKNDTTYELLNYDGGRNYKLVKVSEKNREDVFDFKVYDGPVHWLVDVDITDKQIVLVTVTPDTTYSVFHFVKVESDFICKMYAMILFPPGLRSKNDEPKLQSLTLDKSHQLIAAFDKGEPMAYSFPEGGYGVHVNGKKPERKAGTIYWFDDK